MAFPPLPPTIHPVLVHFTVGLVPAAAGFALLHAWRREEWTRRATYALLTAAAILSLAAMGSGFRDYFAVRDELAGTTAGDILEWHERMGVVIAITLAVTTAIAWWKRPRVAASPRWAWALALALAATTLLVFIAAWYGGSLVYDHGVSVQKPG